MAQRFDWNAPQSEQTEPQDKDWDEFDYVPAQVLNWAWTLFEKNFEGINKGMLIGPNVDEGNLKDPFLVGSGGLYRGGFDEGGVSFYTSWNAAWDGNDWVEVSDTQNLPALIAHDVKDPTQLDGISASDVQGWQWTMLRAASVNQSGVITWQVSPINVGPFYDQTFQDRDNDDNNWRVTEGPQTGHLHYKHPELPADIVFKQDGRIDQRTPYELRDGETLIAEVTGDGSGASGTFDVVNDANIPDDVTELVLKTHASDDAGESNNSFVRIKHPSHGSYHEAARADGASDAHDTNTFSYPLENGKFDWKIQSGTKADIWYLGWRV